MATTTQKTIEKVAPYFTELLIERIENLQNDWQKPWINIDFIKSQNIKGNLYRRFNSFFLSLLAEVKDFKAPIFLTFKQAQEMNLKIKRDSKSFPVVFSDTSYKNKSTGEYITAEQYFQAPNQKDFDKIFCLKYYNVFNIDQTNLAEVNPERYEKLTTIEEKDVNDNMNIEIIDNFIKAQNWICPIKIKKSNSAHFSPNKNEIIIPQKKQFYKSIEFYGTMLHEMAHSTGKKDQLNRDMSGVFGSEQYAKEELIAELTAAICGMHLGVAIQPQENNAAYLKSWLNVIKKEPKFLNDLLTDVNKASKMILEHIETK